MGLGIYLLFVVSWFLHLAARIPALGSIRFDLILILILFGLVLVQKKSEDEETIEIDGTIIKWLFILIVYILVTIPFVYWPGSAVKNGIPQFIKAFLFFIFTLKFIRNERQLKIFLSVFLGCQIFRILEPLYLHLAEGYWGSHASMRGWQYMNRLSGAPFDIVNPNGLAFICLSVLPFLFYYTVFFKKIRVLLFPIILLTLYVLMLTGSRSGIIALIVIFLTISIQSKRKIILPLFLLITFLIGFHELGANFRDRYESIFDKEAKNADTFADRIQGVKEDFEVALHRPIFGHGLGTSAEANFNFRGGTHLSHNLYAEIAQELGFVGLIIFIFYILSLLRTVRSLKMIKLNGREFIESTNKALIIWFYMNLVFSIASYGLTGYQWYLFGALIIKSRAFSLRKELLEKKNSPLYKSITFSNNCRASN